MFTHDAVAYVQPCQHFPVLCVCVVGSLCHGAHVRSEENHASQSLPFFLSERGLLTALPLPAAGPTHECLGILSLSFISPQKS